MVLCLNVIEDCAIVKIIIAPAPRQNIPNALTGKVERSLISF